MHTICHSNLLGMKFRLLPWPQKGENICLKTIWCPWGWVSGVRGLGIKIKFVNSNLLMGPRKWEDFIICYGIKLSYQILNDCMSIKTKMCQLVGYVKNL